MTPNYLRDLVIANRILANEGVADAFGHVSVRNPDNPARYFTSRSRAPELIRVDDLMEFTIDGEAIDLQGRTPYNERRIYGAAYEARPEVNAVIHNHAYEVILSVSPAYPASDHARLGVIGSDIPTWDIRDKFGEGDHLVVTMDQGRDLVRCLGNRKAALHGTIRCVVMAKNVREAVMTAVYLQVNARLLLQSLQLGKPDYLTPLKWKSARPVCSVRSGWDRAWEYWRVRAGADILLALSPLSAELRLRLSVPT